MLRTGGGTAAAVTAGTREGGDRMPAGVGKSGPQRTPSGRNQCGAGTADAPPVVWGERTMPRAPLAPGPQARPPLVARLASGCKPVFEYLYGIVRSCSAPRSARVRPASARR